MRVLHYRSMHIGLLTLIVWATSVQGYATENQPAMAEIIAGKINSKLSLTTRPTFRDITPQHVSADIVHLQQTHAGYDIDQAVIAVRLDERGNIARIYGQVFDQTTAHPINFKRQLLAEQAAESGSLKSIAIAYLNEHVLEGSWSITAWEQKSLMQSLVNTPSSASHWQLVRKITFTANESESNQDAYYTLIIDESSNLVIDAYDQRHFSQQSGSGIGGNVLTGITQYNYIADAQGALSADTFLVTRDNTTCQMKTSPSAGKWQNNVAVFKGKDATIPYEYPCTDINGADENTGLHEEDLSATLQAYSPINDAAYHAQVAFNLYERFAITQTNGPLNEIGRPLNVRVHYTNGTQPSDNAFWSDEFIALGDGRNFFYPKVSADTLGHELAHGFLEHYSLINQNAGIPMGISESFADIAGEATEFAIAQKQLATNDWKYAAQTFRPALEDAARYFETPSLDGNSIESPKHYNYEIKDGHFLAGPFNKAFYHLIHDNEAAGWNPLIGFDLWITAAANCWVPGNLYEAAAQCVVDSVSEFRANNSELNDSWTESDVRYAVVKAFAQANIITEADTDLIALFDFERQYNALRLINKSSLVDSSDLSFQWDTNNDGTANVETSSVNEDIIVQPLENATELTIKLIVSNAEESDEHIQTVNLSPDYCTPSGFGGASDFIKQVAINDQAFPETTNEPGGYTDYTDVSPIELTLDTENTITLTPNDTNVKRDWTVFVDFNGDHDFDDEGEKLQNIRDQGVLVLSINTPGLSVLAHEQVTRMRVVMDWSGIDRPCANASLGEYEDYSVRLKPLPDPVPIFTASQQTDSYNVTVNNNSEHVPADATWLWRYKEASGNWVEFSTSENATVDLKNPGAFVIELQLITSDGPIFRTEQSITLAAVAPSIGFSFNVKKKTSKVTFMNTSTGYIEDASWEWDYGNGETQTFNHFVESHEYEYDVDKLGDDVQEITVTLTVNQHNERYSYHQTISRKELPEAGALAWALPLFIWLLLVRRFRVCWRIQVPVGKEI